MLLSRSEFREAVFSRDKGCVICGQSATAAHHILERRLFPDGGYYLDNGASLCNEHHLEAEKTTLSVEDIRAACGIKDPPLPPHFDVQQKYDKWGNVILQNGMRKKGELFDDTGAQRVLKAANLLRLFKESL